MRAPSVVSSMNISVIELVNPFSINSTVACPSGSSTVFKSNSATAGVLEEVDAGGNCCAREDGNQLETR